MRKLLVDLVVSVRRGQTVSLRTANLSGWKPLILSPKSAPFDFAQGRLSGTRALPVKKLGYDYGIMTIV